MGLTEKIENNTMYLYIISGKLTQKVTADTPNAILRHYEKKDGSNGEKWELHHKNLTAFISGIEFNESEFGEQCILKMTDGKDTACLTMPTNGRYFIDFARKFSNINLEEKITINPYDFNNDGKQLTGISIVQNGKKLENYFWDKENKCAINGIVQPENNGDGFDSDDWKMYFIKLKKFLKSYIEGQMGNICDFAVEKEATEHSVDDVPPEKQPNIGDFSDLPF